MESLLVCILIYTWIGLTICIVQKKQWKGALHTPTLFDYLLWFLGWYMILPIEIYTKYKNYEIIHYSKKG